MSTEIVRYYRVTGVPGALWRGAVSGLAGAVAFVVWVTIVYALVETPWLPLNLVAERSALSRSAPRQHAPSR